MNIKKEVTVKSVSVRLDREELDEAIREYISDNWDGDSDALDLVLGEPISFIIDYRNVDGVILSYNP